MTRFDVTRWHPWREMGKVIRIRHQPMDDLDGYWDPADPDVIVLASQLGQAGRRCTLVHELVHRERGVIPGCGPDVPRQDRREEHAVDLEAARRLITTERLVDALLWSQDENELAEDLWVDLSTVRARLAGLTPDEHRAIDERLWAAEGKLP